MQNGEGRKNAACRACGRTAGKAFGKFKTTLKTRARAFGKLPEVLILNYN